MIGREENTNPRNIGLGKEFLPSKPYTTDCRRRWRMGQLDGDRTLRALPCAVALKIAQGPPDMALPPLSFSPTFWVCRCTRQQTTDKKELSFVPASSSFYYSGHHCLFINYLFCYNSFQDQQFVINMNLKCIVRVHSKESSYIPHEVYLEEDKYSICTFCNRR